MYKCKVIPYSWASNNEALQQRWKELRDEFRQQRDNDDFGGRQLDPEKPYLERLFAPVKYNGPPGTIECFNCEKELAINEDCQCQHPEAEQDAWYQNPGIVKSSRCEGQSYAKKKIYCYYDRHNDSCTTGCRRCRKHLLYIQKLYRATKV